MVIDVPNQIPTTPSGLREYLLKRWWEYARGAYPIIRRRIVHIRLNVNVDKAIKYMSMPTDEALKAIARELVPPTMSRVMEPLISRLFEVIKEMIVRPQVERRIGKWYEESYIDALAIHLLSVLLGVAGNIEVHTNHYH